jgi:hypothetical protein
MSDKVNIKCSNCKTIFNILCKERRWRTMCYNCYKQSLNSKCKCGKLFRINDGEDWKNFCNNCYINTK